MCNKQESNLVDQLPSLRPPTDGPASSTIMSSFDESEAALIHRGRSCNLL
ncbi:hypothetical protein Hanom_Chr00s175025g01830191 [Helianthus anomalus]